MIPKFKGKECICQFCKKIFINECYNYFKRFCSKECKNQYICSYKNKKISCKICGKIFINKVYILRNTCSKECYRKFCSERQKGKNWKEKYGIEKATLIKEKLSISHKKRGKTYEEIYGIEKAIKIKEKLSKTRKGKTLEIIYGFNKAKKLRKKYCDASKKNNSIRKGKKFEEIYNLKKIKEIKEKMIKWNLEDVINITKKELQNVDFFTRKDIKKLHMKKKLPCIDWIRKKCNSIDKFAEYVGIKLERIQKTGWTGKVGKNEKEILDKFEQEKNIKLLRQYYIAGKYLDGYNPITKIVVEYDEPYHKYQQIQDIIRENKIKEKLGCSFIRIKDGW